MTPISAVPLACYAVLIGITSAVLWVWTPYTLPPALLCGGALLMFRDRRDRRAAGADGEAVGRPGIPICPSRPSPWPWRSFDILVGLYLGLYLILIGAGILAFGLGGWIREARAAAGAGDRRCALAASPSWAAESRC